MPNPTGVAVVGGGIIGLSTAIVLAERGVAVTLISGQRPEETTSAVAAAYWTPSFIGQYDHRWAVDTFFELAKFSDLPGSGVTPSDVEEWLDEESIATLDDLLEEVFWWRDIPEIQFRIDSLDTPQRFVGSNGVSIDIHRLMRYRTFVARMPDYLSFLLKRLEDCPNAKIRWEWVESLSPLLSEFAFVVNCTGWQAKYLVPEDDSLRMLVGNVLRFTAPAGGSENGGGKPVRPPAEADGVLPDRIVLGHYGKLSDRFFYIVPRHGSEDDVICGGTAIELAELPPQRDRLIPGEPKIYDAIRSQCFAAIPALARLEDRGPLIGIRPYRDAVRLEFDAKHPNLLHHYGHGGSGMTLSWGSARQAADMMVGR